MSDFVKSQEYSDKDALSSGDPEKLILGTDFDIELDALQVAIATKYDSGDIATQAQAEAGSSNTVLLTPLRLQQWSDYGKGMVTDIRNMADPGADRIVFWDDSADALTFLTVGSGLSLSGTTLSLNLPAIDITSLLGYDANKYMDHTAISITAGTGLSGGGTIAANRTLNFDLTGLTALTSIDTAADYLVIYDASAAAHKKTLVSYISGNALGDGMWRLTGDQSTSAASEATVQFSSTVYNSLQQGSFSTGTYTYTRGATDGRILVSVHLYFPSLHNGHYGQVMVLQNGSEKFRDYVYNTAASTNLDHTAQATGVLNLAAGDTVLIHVLTDANETVKSGAAYSYLSIVELA